MKTKTFCLILLASAPLAPAGEEKPLTSPAPAEKPAPAGEAKSPAAQRLEAGIQLEKTRRHDEALKRFREALDLQPAQALAAQILLEMGKVHYNTGLEALDGRTPGADPEAGFREATKVFEDLLRRYPREEISSTGAYFLGSSHLLGGDFEKALAAYRRAFEDYPGSKDRPAAILRMGVCQAGLDQPREARRTFERILKEFPGEKSDAPRVRKFIDEVSIIGRPAFPLARSQWLQGLVGPEGIKAFDGQVVVLVYLATWCPNCRKELPHLRSLLNRKEWGSRDVVFLGVFNPNDPQGTMPVETYVQENKLSFFDVALDGTAASWMPYRITAFPAAAIIDRKAVVRWRGHLAFFPISLVDKLLKEKG